MTECTCGEKLPVHLVAFVSSHVCSCYREYKVGNGTFVFVGFGSNPAADYDASLALRKKRNK